VTKPIEIADMIQRRRKDLRAIDVLVNNAGIQFVAKVEDFPVEKWDAVIATNLSAAFHTSRCVLPGMKSRGWAESSTSLRRTASLQAPRRRHMSRQARRCWTDQGGGNRNGRPWHHVQRDLSRWVMTPLVAEQVEVRANAAGQSFGEAKQGFVAEKQPMARYTRPRTSAPSLSSWPAMRPPPSPEPLYSIDGGWTAQ